MKSTVTISIGNSDDKLTQKDWAAFCGSIDYMCRFYGLLHFRGFSISDCAHQNATWVVEVHDNHISIFKKQITNVRKEYRQDSAAFTVGQTQFI
jgi:hypothetical protein